MKALTRILSLILAILMLTMTFAACKDDAEDDDTDPGTDDEFQGSISMPDGNGTGNETTETPPIAEGDPNAVIEITTADQLKAIAQNGTYILKNDIDMTGVDFSPIGNYAYPFKGTLKSEDGSTYTIKNLKVNVTNVSAGPGSTYLYSFCGLFGATNGATISNVNVTNADIATTMGDEYCFATAGIISGYMINTTVSDCSVSGKVYAKSKLYNAYAGAFCGILEGGKISDSDTSCEIITEDSRNRAVSGGVCGLALLSPTVSYTNISGSVKASSSYGVAYAGGIVGNSRIATYTACRVNADVYAETLEASSKEPLVGATYAGGLVAVSSAANEKAMTSFTRCYVLDTSVKALGNDSIAYVGGIAGYLSFTTFTHCYSLADVYAKGNTKLAYASMGFGKISTSAGDASAQDYVADFEIRGCFAYGDLDIDHSDLTHLLYGTMYAHITNEGSKSSVKSSYYNQNAVITVNDSTSLPTLLKNGTPRLSTAFTESHISQFGWNADEWETVDGYLYAK